MEMIALTDHLKKKVFKNNCKYEPNHANLRFVEKILTLAYKS